MFIDGIIKEMKTEMGRIGVRLSENRKGRRLPCFFYADDLLPWDESEEESKGDKRKFS